MQRTASEKLLAELIALPSVNPAFIENQPGLTGETRIAAFLAQIGRREGLDVSFQKVSPERSNVLLHLRPKGKTRRRLLLAPHLDTVGLAGAKHDIFSPRFANGRIYGRGACDTKGSVAVMLRALIEVAKARGGAPNTEFVFCGLVDEENGQAGSRALAHSRLKADLAIVGEPTGLKIVTAHKGDLWIRIVTKGKSAHGSQPELGENSILKMARIVDLLETKYSRQLRARLHPLLGSATVNVGSIRGGTQPNIVPAECVIEIDRRSLPGETEHSVQKEILSFLKAHECSAELINHKTSPCPPLETDPHLPLVQKFFQLVGQKEPQGANFFCDAAILAMAGIPSVVFGPGNIAQAHTADEWISVASLQRGTAFFRRFLEQLY